MIRILFLEDDANLAKTLQKFLERNGFETVWVRDGEEAIEITFNERFDLYLLDINVPGVDGLEFLEQLRQAGDNTPALFLSALSDTGSVAKGFMAGADDYIKKPFDPDELLVRIRAKTKSLSDRVQVGTLEVDMQEEAIYIDGQRTHIGEVLGRILFALLRRRPHPVPKVELMELLERPGDLALRVNISKLKNHYGVPIKTIRGVGYQII